MRRGARRIAVVAMLLTASTVGSMRSSGAQIPVGGWSSPNVEWLGNVTLSGTPGAVHGLRHGNYFYVEGLEAIEIFDVSDPLAPEHVSRIPLQPNLLPSAVGVPDIVRDGLDTDGELLVTSTTSPVVPVWTMFVFDVHDKESPRLLARLEDAGSNPVCVLRCTWVYATSGEIIDLRDPANPLVAGRWDRGLDFAGRRPTSPRDALRLTEVAPGRVLTGSTPMYLFDASRPLKPRVLAQSDGSPNSRGTVIWPRMASNGIALSVSSSFLMPRCELQSQLAGTSFDSAFKTWDTSQWKTTGLIMGRSEYRVRNGTYQDGDPAFSGASPLFWGCGATVVDAHPRFQNGGLAVVAASSHGVKFLEIDKRGGIEEVGWFLPYANDTLGAYWITDEIVYTTDWPRGIDILRFTPPR